MGSSLKYWATYAVNVLFTLAFMLACVVRLAPLIKSRTLHRVWRSYFHVLLPYLTAMFLVNLGWRVALIALCVWALGFALTPLYVDRVERRAERAESVEWASLGMEPVIYLRSFAAAVALRRIEQLLEEAADSYEDSENLRFQLNPVALGFDDREGFPKLTTPDGDWWQRFVEFTERAVAIFLLPVVARADPEAGLVRETAHVFIRHPEKLIVIIPDAGTWERLPRDPGEPFDARARWDELRVSLRSVRPSLDIPEYAPSGAVFYMARSGESVWECHPLELSPLGIRSAISEVTRERREVAKQSWQQFESTFEGLNGGMSYSEYYARPGKKLPPNLPS